MMTIVINTAAKSASAPSLDKNIMLNDNVAKNKNHWWHQGTSLVS